MLWRTLVPVTRSKATVEQWMEAARTTRRSRRSGPAEDRAQAGGGPEQEDRGRIRADDVYPGRNAGGAFTNRMTAETLGVRADIACVLYICILFKPLAEDHSDLTIESLLTVLR